MKKLYKYLLAMGGSFLTILILGGFQVYKLFPQEYGGWMFIGWMGCNTFMTIYYKDQLKSTI